MKHILFSNIPRPIILHFAFCISIFSAILVLVHTLLSKIETSRGHIYELGNKMGGRVGEEMTRGEAVKIEE